VIALRKTLFLLPILMALAGCVAHLSQQECATINWHTEGFNDGIVGKTPRDLGQATQDCAQYHIAINPLVYQAGWRVGARKYCMPDYATGFADGSAGKPLSAINSRQSICQMADVNLRLHQYKPGWEKGIASFCTFENGSNLGVQGQALPDVCPADLQAIFLAGWNNGKNQFCGQTANAFALGKAAKDYPAACAPANYPAFKAEYDRGAAVAQQISDTQQKISDLNNDISDRVNQYGFVRSGPCYDFGADRSPDASARLNQTNAWCNQLQTLQTRLANLQITK
jgi:hypothetical protein